MLPVLVHVARLVHAARVLLVAVVLSAVRWFSNLAEAHVAVILGNPPTPVLVHTAGTFLLRLIINGLYEIMLSGDQERQ